MNRKTIQQTYSVNVTQELSCWHNSDIKFIVDYSVPEKTFSSEPK